jgi:hypothetical protein
MKLLKLAGIPTLLVLCVGMAVGQDAAHDVDKAATKTGHIVRHTTKKVVKVTKRGSKGVAHGTKVCGQRHRKRCQDRYRENWRGP